jgi:hypothetical protein
MNPNLSKLWTAAKIEYEPPRLPVARGAYKPKVAKKKASSTSRKKRVIPIRTKKRLVITQPRKKKRA